MKNKKLAGRAMLLCMAGMLLYGCGKKEPEPEVVVQSSVVEAPPVAMNGKKVAVSLPSADSAVWKKNGDYFATHFRNLGYETEVTYCANSAAQQGEDVRRLLAGNCDLLIVAPVDPETLGASLVRDVGAESGEEAVAPSLPPILALGSLVNYTDSVTCAILMDQYEIGVLQAQALIDGLSLKADEAGKIHNIEVVSGDPGDPAAGFVFNGAYDTLKPYLDVGAARILSGQGTFRQTACAGGTAEAAKTRMAGILEEYYGGKNQLDAVLCCSDEEARGVLEALSESYRPRNKVLVTGAGTDPLNLMEIVDGRQAMTVFDPVCEEAVAACDIGVSLMTDEYTDSTIIGRSGWEFPCVYDTSNYSNGNRVVRSFLLEPVAVNAENYQEVLVDTGYFAMNGKYPEPVLAQ